MADPPADLPAVAARFAATVRAAGIPVGADRAERFAKAVTLVAPGTLTSLRACAHATLCLNHEHDAILDAVFDATFGGLLDPADQRGGQPDTLAAARLPERPPVPGARPMPGDAHTRRADGGASAVPGTRGDEDGWRLGVPSIGSDVERLRHREFGELTAQELAMLAAVMAALRIATPPRRSRRSQAAPAGHRIDLRTTLRNAHRTGGDPLRLARRRPREHRRRLVVLCDISGSMEPYARAMLQLLYCAQNAGKAEVFVFATQLTRLTPVLRQGQPGTALVRAGAAAPDWSGGTRIGAAVAEFLHRYGRRGMARGAVMLVISDGWETGDPGQLGDAMAALSRLAYRIVWVNPRTQSPRYRPLVGGMAAAWPYCDAVVSAHRIDALGELIAALAAPHRSRG
jgi:uncharacterized protein with von Willebrand factor type A (vWA) domain